MDKPWNMTGPGSTSANTESLSMQRSGLEIDNVDQNLAQDMIDPEKESPIPLEPTTTTSPTSLTGRQGLGGYGSSMYGGMGGMGGIGSMYGGMGGMYGGMGGYGMGMGNMDPNSSFMQTMSFMQSMSFVVSNMCQIAGMLEGNTAALIQLSRMIVNTVKAGKDKTIAGLVWIKNKLFKMLMWLLKVLRLYKEEEEDENVEDEELIKEGSEEEREKLRKIRKKKALYSFLMKICIGLLLLSLVYFYKIGRSFKVNILKKAVKARAEGAEGLAAEFEKAAF